MSGYEPGTFPMYVITHHEAAYVHERANCSACGADEPDFFKQLMRNHLAPEGFERGVHRSSAVLLVSGPGIAEGKTWRMWAAISHPRAVELIRYRARRDAARWRATQAALANRARIDATVRGTPSGSWGSRRST